LEELQVTEASDLFVDEGTDIMETSKFMESMPEEAVAGSRKPCSLWASANTCDYSLRSVSLQTPRCVTLGTALS
jgi:hypothetical protein